MGGGCCVAQVVLYVCLPRLCNVTDVVLDMIYSKWISQTMSTHPTIQFRSSNHPRKTAAKFLFCETGAEPNLEVVHFGVGLRLIGGWICNSPWVHLAHPDYIIHWCCTGRDPFERTSLPTNPTIQCRSVRPSPRKDRGWIPILGMGAEPEFASHPKKTRSGAHLRWRRRGSIPP